MKNPLIPRIFTPAAQAALAVALLLSVEKSSAAPILDINGTTAVFGATTGFYVPFEAAAGTANWSPDLTNATSYNITSLSVVKENNAVSTDPTQTFFLGVYTGLNAVTNTLSGYLGTSTNSIDYKAAANLSTLTWTFDGTTSSAAAGVGNTLYFVFQLTSGSQSAALLESTGLGGNNTTGFQRVAGAGTASDAFNFGAGIIQGDAAITLRDNRVPIFELVVVPEPSTWALLAGSLAVLMVIPRRRR